jgi:hypothetical protein
MATQADQLGGATNQSNEIGSEFRWVQQWPGTGAVQQGASLIKKDLTDVQLQAMADYAADAAGGDTRFFNGPWGPGFVRAGGGRFLADEGRAQVDQLSYYSTPSRKGGPTAPAAGDLHVPKDKPWLAPPSRVATPDPTQQIAQKAHAQAPWVGPPSPLVVEVPPPRISQQDKIRKFMARSYGGAPAGHTPGWVHVQDRVTSNGANDDPKSTRVVAPDRTIARTTRLPLPLH